jgi:AraC family transcriptional regulator of adaptative response / DNA-3-methyladenine glycosylase II
MGIGSRQLRRVLRQELGVSPVELAQTHRLLLAKQLLTETRLPIVDVAFASGFASVRRFNALFRAQYRLTPRDLRKSSGAGAGDASVRLTLSYRPPLAWPAMLRFLAARAVANVECVCGQSYSRTVALDGRRGWMKVEPAAGKAALTVEVPMSLASVLPQLLAKLRNLFDLDARPDVIAEHLSSDAHLRAGFRQCPGLRVPGAFSGFELAVRAVLGQQVSVRAATTLAGRLAETFGEPITTPMLALTRLSPSPARLLDAGHDRLIALGLVAARARCVLTLARAVYEEGLSLEPSSNPEAGLERLMQLPGVGPWTAHYIGMRALRWPDAFPHTDLGLQKALGNQPPRETLRLAEAWRPWRAYAAMHLWNRSAPDATEE